MSLVPGTPIPAFTITDTEKNVFTAKDLQGKTTLLLFFPLAFTGTCTKELCSVRDDIANYNAMDAQVIGISTDSLFSLGKFKEEQQLNFTLASDYNKEMCTAFNTLYDEFFFGMRGVAKRSAFVVDGNLKVRYAEVLENAMEIPDFHAINSVLSAIREEVKA
jgi:peroxiredoxin